MTGPPFPGRVPGNPKETTVAEIKVQRENRSGNWLWVLLALIAIAAIFFFAFPRGENRTADRPAQTTTSTSGAAPAGPAGGAAPATNK